MAYALYRKYRSKSLDDVVGQSHVTDILSRALKAGRISHAYLLTGPRGVGKTSVARILAHEINSLPYDESSTHLDIIEIDAASNNGVEDVRDLREKVQLAPVSAKKKVYIIDEVHMLSKAAFNALLKTLEEPPEHVVFILATTDLDKLPATIISRTQRYGFRAISLDDAVKHLRFIADQEKIVVSDDALAMIAKRGDGSFRDSISLLDQLTSLTDDKGGITTELIEQSLGLAADATIGTLLEAVAHHDLQTIIATLDQSGNDGVNPTTLSKQLSDAIIDQLGSSPQLLPLLDLLLDVPKSSQPHIKLLTVLGSFGNTASAKPSKTAALSAPVKEVKATIKELEKKAVQPKPKEPPMIKPEPAQIPPEAQPKTQLTGEVKDFDWTVLIEHVRKEHVALYSVLSKCKFELEDTTLTLYTGNPFYKKKIDDAKYSTQLYESLTAIGCHNLAIETLPTNPIMKNSQAAAIADIMGGGEEVSLDG